MSRAPTEAKTVNPMHEDEDTEEEKVFEKPKVDLRPTLIIIAFAVVGLCLGIGLANGRGGKEFISWIKLPGDLFIRALKCVVLPLVFVNIILAVVDMIRAGKASSVGTKTIMLYFITTLAASLTGLIFVLMFQGAFSKKNVDNGDLVPEVRIRCPFEDPEGNQTFLTERANGDLACLADGGIFEINNENDFLQVSEDAEAPADDITFSDTLQDGIFRKLVSDNIVNEFIKANFVGVIVFAIVFGVCSQMLVKQPKIIVELLEESNRIFLTIIDWIIFLTPIAVFSLIAGNLGEQDELADVFKDIGVLIACTLLAMMFHGFVTYPALFYYFVRESPLNYVKFIFPAQVFAFASASSAASLPILLNCVAATGEVPSSIANFVLSMGSTLNMDGGAIYFPSAIVFLAVASGLEDKLDAAAYFMIILLSTIGSAGTAPVPSASLVLIITAYNTVFDETGTPEAFGLVLAIDWLMDRFRTLLNVSGDACMARIITKIAKAKKEDDVLLNKAIEGENFKSIHEQLQI